jgi:hypothetical protein
MKLPHKGASPYHQEENKHARTLKNVLIYS